MRIIFTVVFLVIALLLGFLLYKSIEEPIAFANVRAERQEAVTNKLEMIRKAQELYRDATGEFAPRFDTLKQVLREGNLLLVQVTGDVDAVDGSEVFYDTTYVPLRDTFPQLGIVLDDLEKVPFTDNQVNFDIDAKVIDYQSTTVPVVQVGVKQSAYMGEYASERFQRYDQSYSPNAPIYFGNLEKPTLGGSWQ